MITYKMQLTTFNERNIYLRHIVFVQEIYKLQRNSVHNDKLFWLSLLFCYFTGGNSRAQWEDVTGSTPLTFVKDCVSFTTTVSARFWLMDCRHVSNASNMASELYREISHVPFMAKLVFYICSEFEL